jgi:hypothetical protein
MKKMTGKVLALGAMAVAFALGTSARAEEAETSVTLDAPVLSAYVWRGQVLNDEAVAQPSLTVSKAGFALNYWGNMNLTDETTGDSYEFSEHDLSIAYEFTCPLTGADASIGVVNYDFPNQTLETAEGNVALVENTAETYLLFGFSEVLLAPTLSVYYDFKEADGFYGNFAISHDIEINDKASASLGASVGYASEDYNAFYFGVEEDQWNDANFTLALPFAVNESLTITPGVQYTMLLDGDIEDAADALYKDKEQVVGSLKASYAF